jgi:signal transduction histidine kinase/CRP-like cAMP-binding protein/ActR/RegA family two-component response regulator
MTTEYSEAEILKILKNANRFDQFSETQLGPLISLSEIRRYEKGGVVLAESQINDMVFVLLGGEVAVYAGDEFIVKFDQQGSLVGEMSVITKSLTVASVIAETDSVIFAIPSQKVFESEQLEIKSLLYKVFLDILTEKLTATTQRVIGFQETSEQLDQKKQELAESEDSLQQKEVILQSVLGSMSDGVVVTDASGSLLHVNSAFRSLIDNVEIPVNFPDWPETLGIYQTDEKTLYTAEALPMVKIMQGVEVDSEEMFISNNRQKEGVWLQASSRLLKNENMEAATGAVVVFRDYTKKKKEEQALIKAKETAEAMAKSKSDFLAVMSHELRTPLNGILGMTELLTTTTLNDEQKECLDTIRTSGNNLLQIVRNILDYNNLESGTRKLAIDKLSIKECFKEIQTSFEPSAKRKSIIFETHIADELPEEIEGDTKAILQILRNLTDNAIKFSEKGKTTVSVRLDEKNNDSIKLTFTVEDQGIGVDQKDHANLFQPFSQVDSSYSRKFEGVGIGLSICKRLVELMKGKIWIESEPDKGSKFHFTIETKAISPKTEQPAEAGASAKEEDVALDQNFAEKFAMKILVAEDNPMNQKLITKVLKKLGYAPELASNGLEAVEMSKQEAYDIILMDLQMPEMDGIEASRIIINELEDSNKPKIIALTANVSDEVKEACVQVGMSDYMTKPLKIDKLATILQKYA